MITDIREYVLNAAGQKDDGQVSVIINREVWLTLQEPDGVKAVSPIPMSSAFIDGNFHHVDWHFRESNLPPALLRLVQAISDRIYKNAVALGLTYETFMLHEFSYPSVMTVIQEEKPILPAGLIIEEAFAAGFTPSRILQALNGHEGRTLWLTSLISARSPNLECTSWNMEYESDTTLLPLCTASVLMLACLDEYGTLSQIPKIPYTMDAKHRAIPDVKTQNRLALLVILAIIDTVASQLGADNAEATV